MSEPPIALGRGLLVTTSAIGCAIGLAILWMLFPVGGSAPTAQPVVSQSVRTAPPRSAATDAESSTTGGAESSELVTPSSTGLPIGSLPPAVTLPAEDVPSNTVMLHSEEPVENAAIAVLIGDSSVMITTANAVGDATELSVMLDSGDTSMATVVQVSDALAYLEPSEGQDGEDLVTVGFATSTQAQPGDVLHVLAPETVTFTFDGDHALGDVLGAGVVEGTPVVNDEGALVALCSHDSQGVVLVPVPAPEPADPPVSGDGDGSAPAGSDTAQQPTSTTSPTSSLPPAAPGTGTTVPAATGEAWLGVRLAPTSDGLPGVLVQSVGAGSPAAAAGFAPGQRILAIDDEEVDSASDVAAILQGHRPGDLIVVTVSLPAGTDQGPTTTVPATTGPATTGTAAAPTTSAPPATSVTSVSTTAAPASTTKPSTSAPSTTSSTPSTPSSGPFPTTTAAGAGTGAGADGGGTANPNVVTISVVLGEREPTV